DLLALYTKCVKVNAKKDAIFTIQFTEATTEEDACLSIEALKGLPADNLIIDFEAMLGRSFPSDEQENDGENTAAIVSAW
ncbi:hypothetical protein ABTK17_20385, partial [Acinetobacter baumannii]